MMQSLTFKRIVTLFVLPACLIVMLPTRAASWGEQGHQIVARIAVSYLNDKAKDGIIGLLLEDIQGHEKFYEHNRCSAVLTITGKAKDNNGVINPNKLSADDKKNLLLEGLACIATWPDPPYVKYQRPYTANWHFVDIPVTIKAGKTVKTYSFDPLRDCVLDNKTRERKGDCAVFAIERFRSVLSYPRGNNFDVDYFREEITSRIEALKFIVHLMGDLHQPMHCVTQKDLADKKDRGDAGGNAVIVLWFEQTEYPYGLWNLHAVWDEGIIDRTLNLSEADKKNPTKIAALETAYIAGLNLPPQGLSDLTKMQAGDIFDWLAESYNLAVTQAYGKLPPIDNQYTYQVKNFETGQMETKTGKYPLGKDYYANNTGIVDQQLRRAGVRLAKLLNEDFNKPATP